VSYYYISFQTEEFILPVSVVSSNEQEQEEICFTDIIEADGRVVFVGGEAGELPPHWI